MNRIGVVIAVLAAITAAFFAGKHVGESSTRTVPTIGAVDAADSNRGDATTSARLAGGTSDGAKVAASMSGAYSAGAMSDVPTPASGQSSTASVAANGHAGSGPQVLSAADAGRLREWLKVPAAAGTDIGDLQELSDKEKADADAAFLESLITDAIRRHGRNMTALQLGAPHCTQTLCSVQAIGRSSMQDPQSDWQWLLRKIYAEPWFKQHFLYPHLVAGSKGKDAFYVSYFIRK